MARGVKEISGDIVGDDSYFPRERYPTDGKLTTWSGNMARPCPRSSVNDNTVTLMLVPGHKTGEAAAAELELATSEFVIKNEVTTISAKEKGELRLTREPGAESIVVSGTIPAGSQSRKLVLAIQEPAQHAATLLASLLSERGIKFHGKIRSRHDPDPSEGQQTVLAEHLSLPLGDTVKLVNKISQNLHTEVLLRTAARQQGPWATPEELQKFPETFYAKVGIASGDVIQTDRFGACRGTIW